MSMCPLGKFNNWKSHGKCSKCGKKLYFDLERKTGICSVGKCSNKTKIGE